MSRIKCQIMEASPQRIKFVLNNCDVSLANALRRVLISEIPTMAVHRTWYYDNTSVLHDQFLNQRIALIPFVSQKADDYTYSWKCNCIEEGVEDCSKCKIQFRLQVHHKDTYEGQFQQFRDVTSLDIQPLQMVDEHDNDFGRKPVLPVKFKSVDKTRQVGIPIVRLNKGEQINMRFNVMKGIGKMHAKWSPVQLATFQPDPQIKINHDIETTLQQKKAIVDSCPTKVFEIHNNALQVVNLDKCIFCGECQKKAESINMQKLKNYIKIGKKKDRFIFTVQSVGSMPAPTIVKKAMSVLRQKLMSVQQNIESKS